MFSPLHPSLPLPSFCASDHSPHLFVLTLFLFFFSLNPPSVFLLDRGGPASETQAWYLPLPQLPHPLHRHSVSSWFWLSGLWSWLRPQSHHPTPSPLHSLRLCLAEKERVLHRGPAAGSLRYSRTAVCHQVTRPHECVWASLVHWVMSRTVQTPIESDSLKSTQHACCYCPELTAKPHDLLIVLIPSRDAPTSACGLMRLWDVAKLDSRSVYASIKGNLRSSLSLGWG